MTFLLDSGAYNSALNSYAEQLASASYHVTGTNDTLMTKHPLCLMLGMEELL